MLLQAWPEGAKRPRLTREACQPGHARLLVTRAYKKESENARSPIAFATLGRCTGS